MSISRQGNEQTKALIHAAQYNGKAESQESKWVAAATHKLLFCVYVFTCDVFINFFPFCNKTGVHVVPMCVGAHKHLRILYTHNTFACFLLLK